MWNQINVEPIFNAMVAQWLGSKSEGSGFEARHCNVVIRGLVHSTMTEYLAGRDGFVTD